MYGSPKTRTVHSHSSLHLRLLPAFLTTPPNSNLCTKCCKQATARGLRPAALRETFTPDVAPAAARFRSMWRFTGSDCPSTDIDKRRLARRRDMTPFIRASRAAFERFKISDQNEALNPTGSFKAFAA